MAGIYVHIPFCKQACSYCNFHFSTTDTYRDRMVQAICKEIEIRSDELGDLPIETIYIGGGTPSLLTYKQLSDIFCAISDAFSLSYSQASLGHAPQTKEITIETNPDDLNTEYVNILGDLPVNRLSIGVQSFFDQDLRFMNRAHSAEEAKKSVEIALSGGFEKSTIDLIYGSPGLTNENWQANIRQAFELGIRHISAYHLTVEPRTPLDHWVKTGKIRLPADTMANEQFEILMEEMNQRGWIHYEISNYASDNSSIAIHNTNYWKSVPYLGIGPSAHSFRDSERSWNIANNVKYMKAIEAGALPSESEHLDAYTRYNEYVMVRLRTKWGIDRSDIDPVFLNDLDTLIHPFVQQGKVKKTSKGYVLTQEGKFLADGIASALMLVP